MPERSWFLRITGVFRLARDFGIYMAFLVSVMFLITMIGLVLAQDPGPSDVVIGGPIPAPEFPSAFIPALVITSFAGAVLVIRRIVDS